MRLAADIGGTKSLVALVKDGQIVCRQRYENQEWGSVEALLADFLGSAGSPGLMDACLAVAGPVVGNTCDMTSLPWTVGGSQISQQFGGILVQVINDFTAVGYGIPHLGAADLHVLQVGIPEPQGPVAFLGAGTGLGQGYGIWHQDHYRVYASEGGHTDFAPRSQAEWDLVVSWQQTYGWERVSVERLVSGPGIPKIYRYLTRQPEGIAGAGERAVEEEKEEISGAGISAEGISAAALQGGDPVAVATMRLFVQAYGAEAGNVALKWLPRGGLYIAGGIALQIMPLLERFGFMAAFADKGRMRPLLGEIPVAVIQNPEVGLLGAAYYPEPIA